MQCIFDDMNLANKLKTKTYLNQDNKKTQTHALYIYLQRVLALCYFWNLEKNRISQKSHKQNFNFMYAVKN